MEPGTNACASSEGVPGEDLILDQTTWTEYAGMRDWLWGYGVAVHEIPDLCELHSA